jgi:hypothetical protein
VTSLSPSLYVSQEAPEAAAAWCWACLSCTPPENWLAEPSSGVFDWEQTVTDRQLRTAAEIREYLKPISITFPATYRIDGNDAEGSYLVYLFRLLGHQAASYDPVSKVLIVREVGTVSPRGMLLSFRNSPHTCSQSMSRLSTDLDSHGYMPLYGS